MHTCFVGKLRKVAVDSLHELGADDGIETTGQMPGSLEILARTGHLIQRLNRSAS